MTLTYQNNEQIWTTIPPMEQHKYTPNVCGSPVFATDDERRLRRFLILGCEGPTYYQSQQELQRENAKSVVACWDLDPRATLAVILDIVKNRRAPKIEPALFALALGASLQHSSPIALGAVSEVCKTGTHILHFAAYCNGLRGWGRGLRRAIGNWYTAQHPNDIAYQALKYQQRDGWSHRDLLRLSHPTPINDDQGAVFKFITAGKVPKGSEGIAAVVALKEETDEGKVVKAIIDHKLTREMIPTQWLNSPAVWEALLAEMPSVALVRNLAKMTSIGLVKPGLMTERTVCEKLRKAERLHPIQLLSAYVTYRQGKGMRGSLTWVPCPDIVATLEEVFYESFNYTEPLGGRLLVSVDVSGSMTNGEIAGVPGLTPHLASACMSLLHAKRESSPLFCKFSTQFAPMTLTRADNLTSAGSLCQGDFGATDCSAPFRYAMNNKLDIDTFIVYTDSETNLNTEPPDRVLMKYRQEFGIPAKLIVVAMTSGGFTIADPGDHGMLDVVGFDSGAFSAMSEFTHGGF